MQRSVMTLLSSRPTIVKGDFRPKVSSFTKMTAAGGVVRLLL